jgi:prepilin-type N-terminal cleavage/methylation domain-containing protein
MRRRGFTLVETLLVIVIMGLVVGLAIPRLSSAAARRNLRGSRNTIASLYTQARITAMQRGSSAALQFDGDKVFVTAGAGATYDTVGAVRNLGTDFGVTIDSDPDSIVIDSKGFLSDDAVVRATRDGYTDSVYISRYGRLDK